MAWRIGVDTGGTFTDVVAVNEATGKRYVRKTSSTPDDPSLAVDESLPSFADNPMRAMIPANAAVTPAPMSA